MPGCEMSTGAYEHKITQKNQFTVKLPQITVSGGQIPPGSNNSFPFRPHTLVFYAGE